MALINKIREKSGLAVAVVAFGLILFLVGGDLLGPNSVIMGNKTPKVGTIAGKDVTLEEFQVQVEELKRNYASRQNRQPSENEMDGIRQQAWELLIAKIAYQKEYDQLGLGMTESEMIDMVQGANVSPEIKQVFTNPQTGQFDKAQVLQFLQNLDKYPAQTQQQWYDFERTLGPSRLRLKYENLLISTEYVTKEEAKRDYEAQTASADIKYLYIPFFAVSDSTVKVEDSKLNDYINKNKDKYKIEEGASLEYVTFPVLASTKDSTFFQEEITKLAAEFITTDNDSSFARRNSETSDFYNGYSKSDLPAALLASGMNKGDIVGPVLENGSWNLYKLADIFNDTVYSMRASHILIKPEGDTDEAKAAALAKAKGIIKEIKQGKSFEEMALIHGTDGTRTKGGDLGWFSEGRMVAGFEAAVLKMNGTGLIQEPVKTDFGYHIIKVTEPKTKQKFKVATISRQITPGDETRDAALRKADYFAANSRTAEDFRANVKKDSLVSSTATKIGKNDRSINDITSTREIVKWVYNDADANDVSQVYDMQEQDKYVVVLVTEKTEKGIAGLSTVRDEVLPKVKNDIKGKQIADKLAGVSGTSLEDIATKYGANATVYSMSNVNFNTTSLTNVGFAPLTIGKVFGLDQGKRSEAIVDENGVLIVEVTAYNKATEIADYSSYKDQLAQRRKSRSQFNVSEAIKFFADIKDERSKYF